MTATPHNGKEEDFQLFLSLLDSDRFYGKFRDGVHKVDASDLMRRMVKEELVKFDGTPLFPERKAYTVNYKLSDIEAALYEAVTQYVQTEMGKADAARKARARARSASRSPPSSAASPPAPRPSTNRSSAAGSGLKAAFGRRSSASAVGRHWPRRLPPSRRTTTTSTPRSRRHLEETLVDDATAARTHRRAGGRNPHPRRPRTAGQGRRRVGPGPQVGGALEDPPERPRDARRLRPPAQDHHLLRASRHAELSARQDRRRARQPATPSSPSTAARTATSAAGFRRCSAPTPTSACWSPPTPPAKASTSRTPT